LEDVDNQGASTFHDPREPEITWPAAYLSELPASTFGPATGKASGLLNSLLLVLIPAGLILLVRTLKRT